MIWQDFIPSTCERSISTDIVFRPVRSWHSGTFAGEGLFSVEGDGSGCLRDKHTTSTPLTVTHRQYWNKKTGKHISAFLSYPGGMGYFGTSAEGAKGSYFWEIMGDGDIERFAEEEEMEERIKQLLTPVIFHHEC